MGFSALKTQLIFNGYNCRAAKSEKRGIVLIILSVLALFQLIINYFLLFGKVI